MADRKTEIDLLAMKLADRVGDDTFLAACDDFVEAVEERPNAVDALPLIFRLFEAHPKVYFGDPGPLAHFAENFFQHGYEEQLYQSLRRRPTPHTVWLLNRIINGQEGDARRRSLDVLDAVIAQIADAEVKAAAIGFRALH